MNMDGRGVDGSGLRLGERDIGRAAADLLGANSDRRKRGRASSVGSNGHGSYGVGDAGRKRRVAGAAPTINVGVAVKAATALARESPSYKRLVEMEERLDLAIMRKQQDIREALKAQAPVCKRVFRLYLFNTYRSQPGTDGVTDEDVPSWSLRIQGQLLPSQPPSNANAAARGGPSNQPNANSAAASNPASGQVPQNQPGNVINGMAQAGNPTALPAHGQPTILNHGVPHQNPAAMPSLGQQHQAPGYPPQGREEGPNYRCSDIFKRIVIELDNKIYPENNLIEWKRNERDLPSDGFEISRRGNKECKVRVYLDVNHTPELYKLSQPLSSLLGLKTDTRAGIFVGIWQYVKKMRLQCVDDRTAIRLDQGLKSLLPQAQRIPQVVRLQHLYEIVKTHMGPPDPLEIVYDVRLSGNVVDNQDCYDIQVNVEDRALQESAQKSGIFGLTFPTSAEYAVLKEKHLEALDSIAIHKRRRDFFEGFCANPIEFINHLVLSQTRDLKVLGGSTGRNPEEERRSTFYQQQWVHEAIPRYLLRKAIADTAKKTSDTMK